jgi:hypothetical protein
MTTDNQTRQLARILRRIEVLVEDWPHLLPYLEQTVKQAEEAAQQWKAQR